MALSVNRLSSNPSSINRRWWLAFGIYMNDIYQLFYQLIRVAIGNQVCLSHTPSADEWGELYALAKKQSLVGVCFAGVQKLTINHSSLIVNLSESLRLQWMGMAAKIQQRNEVLNRRCAELAESLKLKGYRASVLKGQSLAPYYGDLAALRQSGDIDVWVQNKSIEELVKYVKGLGVNYKATAAHVECQLFDNTNVELHAEPAFMRNFFSNRKLVQWFNSSKGSIVESELGFNVPTSEFNLVYMMVHMYHHVLLEGLGLRQLMDYYFVLRTVENSKECREGKECICSEQPSIPSILSVLDSFGMKKFASGIMWVVKTVLVSHDNHNLDDNLFFGIEPNEKVGRLLLDEIMAGGNFGHHDEKNKNLHGGTAVGRSLSGLKRNMKFFALGHWEILCSPLWSTWHWWWRRIHTF